MPSRVSASGHIGPAPTTAHNTYPPFDLPVATPALMSEAYPPSASATLSPSAEQRLRQRLPRMPWHDLHVCLSGAAARDVGLHFMQRWNHHRLSKAVQDTMPVLRPPVDDPWFGVCASCAAPVHECQSHCTTCGHDVGRPSAAYVGPVPPPTDKPGASQPSISSSSSSSSKHASPTYI